MGPQLDPILEAIFDPLLKFCVCHPLFCFRACWLAVDCCSYFARHRNRRAPPRIVLRRWVSMPTQLAIRDMPSHASCRYITVLFLRTTVIINILLSFCNVFFYIVMNVETAPCGWASLGRCVPEVRHCCLLRRLALSILSGWSDCTRGSSYVLCCRCCPQVHSSGIASSSPNH